MSRMPRGTDGFEALRRACLAFTGHHLPRSCFSTAQEAKRPRRKVGKKSYDAAEHSIPGFAKAENFKTLGRRVQAVGERLDKYLAISYPFRSRTHWRDAIVSGRVRVQHGKANGDALDPSDRRIRGVTNATKEAEAEREGGEGGEGGEGAIGEACDGLENLHVVKRHYRLQNSDQLFLYFPEEPGPLIAREGIVEQVAVLADCGDFAAFFKPPHLVVHPTGAHRYLSLIDVMKERGFGDHMPVHRLDRETSGVVLAARSAELRTALHTCFSLNQMRKMYLCVTQEILEPSERLTVELPDAFKATASISMELGDLTRTKRRVARAYEEPEADPRSLPCDPEELHAVQEASTSVMHLAENTAGFHLVACFPHSGRTHQIRVHLAAVGHWIVGDKIYFPDEQLFHTWREEGDSEAVLSQLQHPRQLLHHAGIMGHPSLAPISLADKPVTCHMPDDMLEFPHVSELLRLAAGRLGVGMDGKVERKERDQQLSRDVTKAVWDIYAAGGLDDVPAVI